MEELLKLFSFNPAIYGGVKTPPYIKSPFRPWTGSDSGEIKSKAFQHGARRNLPVRLKDLRKLLLFFMFVHNHRGLVSFYYEAFYHKKMSNPCFAEVTKSYTRKIKLTRTFRRLRNKNM